MNKYQKYYKKVEKYQKSFENLLDKLRAADKEEEKFFLAQAALTFAVFKNTGYFTSSVLENFYTDYAKSIDIDDYNVGYKPKTFLHVLTSGYNTGGHTRVVERWIKNAPENESHSVVLLNQEERLQVLEDNAKEKNGKCVYFEPGLSLKEKALMLRKLGLKYEYIILHTHMDDPTATVAFGSEKFTRPVIFYNHASHLFWIGKSIADVTVDILEYDKITRKNRGIENVFHLGIPIELAALDKKDKMICRKKLNLPLDKKIIVSAGDKKKYIPLGSNNFIETMKKIVDNDTYCYVMGPSKKDKGWKEAFIKTKGHIIPLGRVGFNCGYLDYIGAADLYIDSTPFCGWTAVIDAVSSSVPVLCYENTQLDYMNKTNGCAANEEEIAKKAKVVLNDEKFAKELADEELKSLIKMQSKEAWNKNMEELLKIVPKTHNVKMLKEDDFKEIVDLCVLDNAMLNKTFFKPKILSKLWHYLGYLICKICKNREKEIQYLVKILG